jgi:mannose-6-phosphate isomerase
VSDHPFEQRPWGTWYVLDEGRGYKVERIHVHPGCRLSYQFHEHRSEHRFVIEGMATATIDDEVLLAAPDPSVDVPQGSAHRLANEGPRRLVVIEVRRGAYTGEDDMTRHEGNYGRCRPYEQIVDVADA